MQTVWKYEISNRQWKGVQSMPLGAKFVLFGFQGQVPCMWFEVDPQQPLEDRYFEVFGTGHEVRGAHLGSTQVKLNNIEFVWHLYDVSE